jgi:hypothetical protein
VPTVAVAQDGRGAIGAGKVAVAKLLPPKGAFDAGLRPDPFPDRIASLLPSLLVAARTGLTPAGDDELMLVSATQYPLPTLGARTIRASLRTAFPSGRGRSGRGLGAAPFAWGRGRLLEE